MDLNPYESPHSSWAHQSRHRSALPRVRWPLLATTAITSLVGMYVGTWEQDPVTPAVVTMILSALAAVNLQRMRSRSAAAGAIAGGAVGANLAVALHFFCGYTMLEYFEDEGLGFAGGVLVFFPYASLFGVAIGALVWLTTVPILWITSRWRASN